MLARVKIVSPLSGYIWPLDRISDSDVAQRVMGTGIERSKSTTEFQYGNKQVNARSMTAIISLQVPRAAKVQVLASGAGTKAAGEQLEELLAQGSGDAGHVPASATATTTISPTAAPASHCKSSDPKCVFRIESNTMKTILSFLRFCLSAILISHLHFPFAAVPGNVSTNIPTAQTVSTDSASGIQATSVPPPTAPAKRSAAELEKLAVPIALHPDPLISIILPASVFPVEVVMAARFVRDTNNIPKLDAQPWDENVKAVAKFPELIAKMDQDLTWTIDLGQAFLEQRKELMDTIQALRLKAQNAGTLKTTPEQVVIVTNSIVERAIEQQVVVVTNTIVQIEPSNPQVIYVPSYPPTVYYPPPPAYGYPSYYGYGYYPYAPLVSFGIGMAWGAAISHHYNHCNWHGGDVDIDVNRNANFNRNVNNVRGGDRVSNRGSQSWQPDQNRLRSAGVPSAKTRDAAARGYNNSFGGASGRPSQYSSGLGGARSSGQQSIGGGAARPAQTANRSAGVSQRPVQRAPTGSTTYRPSSTSRSSAFSGVNGGGGSTRNYSSRGSYSRGSGGFSGGGGRGGGGRGGGGRR